MRPPFMNPCLFFAALPVRVPLNPGTTIERVTFSYRYDTGYGPTGTGTNFSLRVAGRPVYASPHLTDYEYSHNRRPAE